MTEEKKDQISELLAQRKEQSKLSDAKLGTQIGINDSTVNHIINKRYIENPQMVSDKMFQQVASWLNVNDDWVINREDKNFLKVYSICENAQVQSESFAISAPPGMCKTIAAEHYAKRPNVYYLSCAAHWPKHIFLLHLARAMGIHLVRRDGRLDLLVEKIKEKLARTTKPLIILDEADKLSDGAWQFFITFYNSTLNNCGFVFLGSVFFAHRIMKGVQANRMGYAEFYSRVGREIIQLHDWNKWRITEICKMNGITDEQEIIKINNRCENDGRQLKRLVDNVKRQQKLQTELVKKNGISKEVVA